MSTLRSKDEKIVKKKEDIEEDSPLLTWMKGGAKKGNVVKDSEVKKEMKTEKPKVKVELRKRSLKVEDNEDEDSDASDNEEEQEEWKSKKNVVTKVKKVAKLKGEKPIKPGSKKVNKRKQGEEETEEGEKAEEELKPKKVVPTRLKRDMKPKKEELDNSDILDQEEEAQQDEDARDCTVGDTDFNEYERQRQENILKNKLLLQQLQLGSIALGSKPKPKPKPAHKSVNRKKKESSVSTIEHVPRRQSSRIAGLPADSEKAKRKYEEESAALEQAERAKRMRVGGDIKFDVGGIDLSVKGTRYERTFTDEDVKNTDNMDVKRLREKMMGLKLYERWAVNGEFYKHAQFPILTSASG